MKKIKIIFLALAAFAGSFLVSCSAEDPLATKKTGNWTENYVWTVPDMAQGVLIKCYDAIPRFPDTYDNNFLDVATDNAATNSMTSAIYYESIGKLSRRTSRMGCWDGSYKAFEWLHAFLENGLTDEVIYNRVDPTVDAQVKLRLKGEALWLRAFYGSRLLQRYAGRTDAGDVLGYPIVTEFIDEEEAKELDAFERDSFEACVEQIVKDCDDAITLLPLKYTNASAIVDGVQNIGRANGLCGYALKSRILLMAASPAYQPATVVQINGVGDYDVLDAPAMKVKWERAALYANECLQMSDFATYNSQQPTDIVDASSTTPGEFIYRRYFTSNAMEGRHYPPYYGGSANSMPSQNLVDAYPMLNGFPISDTRSGYDPANPYAGRDIRLENTIYHHGSTFATSDGVIDIRDGAKDCGNVKNGSRTGYYVKKYMSKRDKVLDPIKSLTSPHYWATFRKAEVWFNYAEAANEAWGPYGKGDGCTYSAYDVMKLVRAASAGITDTAWLDEVAAQGTEAFRALILNERRLEFAFESQRYWDIRRCLLPLNQTIYGAKVVTDEITGQDRIEQIVVEERPLNNVKFYFDPIPYDEMSKSSNMVNNMGWE